MVLAGDGEVRVRIDGREADAVDVSGTPRSYAVFADSGTGGAEAQSILEVVVPPGVEVDEAQRVGELLGGGTTGSTARAASAPWPISRRFGEPTRPVSPLAHGGHVVVVQVALRASPATSVSISWFMRGMASVHDVEHLGLATLEQAGAVRRRQHADLGRHRAQVGEATAVDADALVDDRACGRASWSASGRLP